MIDRSISRLIFSKTNIEKERFPRRRDRSRLDLELFRSILYRKRSLVGNPCPGWGVSLGASIPRGVGLHDPADRPRTSNGSVI